MMDRGPMCWRKGTFEQSRKMQDYEAAENIFNCQLRLWEGDQITTGAYRIQDTLGWEAG